MPCRALEDFLLSFSCPGAWRISVFRILLVRANDWRVEELSPGFSLLLSKGEPALRGIRVKASGLRV